MQWQHPHLTMAQVHAALSYYFDHRPEIDAEIAQGLETVDKLRQQQGNAPTRRQLLGRRQSSYRQQIDPSARQCGNNS